MKLKGLKNLRSVGGYKLADGSVVRQGLIYRSDSLDSLSSSSARKLVSDLGVDTIVDLRTGLERSEKPDVIPAGVNYLHMPIFDESVIGITKETGSDTGAYIRRVWSRKKIREALPDMRKIYFSVFSDPAIVANMREVLKIMMDNAIDGKVTLIHCSQGKDRTGSIVALLLTILGVDRRTIISDYVRGGCVYAHKAIVDAILVSVVKFSPDVAATVYGASVAKRDFIKETFRSIEENYGSTDALIHDVFGFGDDFINRFRKAMVA